MKFCIRCGKDLPDDALFCSACGAAFTDGIPPEYAAPAEPEAPADAEHPAEPEIPAEPAAQAEPVYSEPAPEPAHIKWTEPAPVPKASRGTNGLAIAGFATAFCAPIIGIILSSMAKRRADSGEYKNPLTDFAVWGIVIGIIALICCIVAAAAWTFAGVMTARKIFELISENTITFY